MISAVILTKNDEQNIKACLESISWCDEIIIIDDNSIDKTVDIAKKSRAKIVSRQLNHNFAEQRNFGLEKAKGDWILLVDADDRISSALWYEIMAVTNEPIVHNDGFYLKRRDYMWGKELRYGEMGNVRLIRLARKESGVWQGKVHEEWKVKGKILTLINPLKHYPHQTVKEFLSEINYYSDLRAKELYKKKVKASWFTILLYPKAKFVVNYFFKAGFLDGLPGFICALMMSLHSFLVRGKLWLLWQQN